MNKLILKTLTAVCLISSAALSAAEDMTVKSDDTIAFLGDSITQFGNRPYGYVQLVIDGLKSVQIDVKPIPAGVSGNKSNDMLKRVDKVLSMKPDWLLLSCGVNDVGHGKKGVELPEFKKNITELLDKVDKAGVKVMIMTPTLCGEKQVNSPNNKKLEGYCEFLRKLAKERKYLLADCNQAMRTMITENSENPGFTVTIDNLHMNGYGNQMMAATVLKAFGLTPKQIADCKVRWNKIPSMTPVLNHAQNGGWLVNMDTYLKIQRELQRRKLQSPEQLFDLKLKEYINTLKKK